MAGLLQFIPKYEYCKTPENCGCAAVAAECHAAVLWLLYLGTRALFAAFIKTAPSLSVVPDENRSAYVMCSAHSKL